MAVAHYVHGLFHDYTYVDSVLQQFEKEGIRTDRFQRYKLWCLLGILEKEKPKTILEMGSGSSTTIFSDYADANNASVISLETDPRWAELVKRHIGKNVKILECKAAGNATTTPKTLRFDVDLKGQDFDLVMIDGPGDKIEGISKKEGATVNVLELEPLPKTVLIDGRKATVLYMKAHPLLQDYDFTANDLHVKKCIKSGYNFFSIFRRR